MNSKRVLLNENMPPKLRQHLTGHIVITTQHQGWKGKKNGELVALAERDKFDVFVTQDHNLVYQQDLRSRAIALVVLIRGRAPKTARRRSRNTLGRNNQEEVLLANAERILAAINAAKTNNYIELIVEPRTPAF